jgi:putative transposase
MPNIVTEIKFCEETEMEKNEHGVSLKSRLPCLWTRSYFAESVGHISEATIKKYIEEQKNK